MSLARNILKSFLAKSQPEGVGATVRRCISARNTIDPFLMCDLFEVSPPAGFPDHPHRGFETVTYMLEGTTAHEDFEGNKGLIGPGDVQWMTAGRGIIHSEMPVTKSKGIQLWVNLSSKDKKIAPSYQDLKSSQIPIATPDSGVEVKVIAGTSHGITSKIFTRTPTMLMDFKLSKGKSVVQDIPIDFQGFIFVLEGSGYFGGNSFKGNENHALYFENNGGDHINVEAKDEDVRFMLIAGKPLGEPIESYGPFVMNTKEEIAQTRHDFMNYTNGFEKARGWQSTIGYGVSNIDFTNFETKAKK
ncbi:6344_t:CDS:2 [Acaulospora morrowiae]|uniref:6344_t:CDS:1 n=1 Tax=Acaulospora morrowiae TaxID=94023 RepID=A0A9N9AK22_9GLOM|nr:6344_t:CDS:2 [Acaulospora morrowiae]